MFTSRDSGVRAGAVGAALVGAAAASGGDLDDLFDRYAGLDSLGLNASVQFKVIDPIDATRCCPLAVGAGEIVEGSFTYAADWDRWRMDSFLDPSQFPGMNTTLLYDGADFAYLDNGAGVLSIETGNDPSRLGMMLLNPAFEPIQFLFPLSDANQGTQPQLADARAAAGAASGGVVSWSAVVFEGKPLDRAEFPGATFDGVAYTHRVYAKPGEHDRPLVIERVDGAGQVITRTRLSGYEDVLSPGSGPEAWPRSVLWQTYDVSEGNLVVEISMTIDWIVVNDAEALAADVFDIQSLPLAGVTVIDGTLQP